MKIKTMIKVIFGCFALHTYGDVFQDSSIFKQEKHETAFLEQTEAFSDETTFSKNFIDQPLNSGKWTENSVPIPLIDNSENSLQNWMEHHQNELAQKKLKEIILPGSHDSGAYVFTKESKLVELPGWLNKPVGTFIWSGVVSTIKRWCKTQKLNIHQQLQCGIRYFDLRVSQDTDKKFYLYHGLQSVEVEGVFKVFAAFLAKNKGEIIILDLSHFKNVNHENFIKLIQKYLGEFSVPKDVLTSATYENLIKNNQRCCLFYDNSFFSKKYKFLLGKSDSFWANKQNIRELKQSLSKYHEKTTHSKPWVLQWVLTPNAKYVAKHLSKSVEDLAKITHQDLMPFLKEFQKKSALNIVMFDFVNRSLCKSIIDLNF